MPAEPAFPGTIRKEILDGLKRITNCGLKIGSGKVTMAKVRREDWAESWKRHFKPIEIGNALLVKPSWSKKHPRRNQAVVMLDPGLSFGTGQHPTTAFCLHELARCGQFKTRRSFLDMGPVRGFWRLRRRNWVILRFTPSILIPKRFALRAPTPAQTAFIKNCGSRAGT